MNYRRGRWKRTFSGSLAPARFGKLDPKALAMRLHVTLRPSPQDVSISLSHRAFFPANKSLSTKDTQLCAQWVKSEVNALAAYLANAYQLAEVPVDHQPPAPVHDSKSDALAWILLYVWIAAILLIIAAAFGLALGELQ